MPGRRTAPGGVQHGVRIRHRPAGAVVLAGVLAAVCSTPAGAQRLQRGQTVLDRPRPLFQAQGVPLGGLRLWPALSLGQSYVDNLLAESDGGDADLVTRAAPELAVRSDWRRHALGLHARAERSWHVRRREEDTLGWDLGGTGRLDLGRHSHVKGGVGWARRFEGRTSPDDPGTRAPIAFDLLRGRLGARVYESRVVTTLRAEVRRYDYRDARTRDGAPVNNDDRDHVRYALSAENAVPVLPRATAFLRGRLDARRYDVPLDDAGYVRDSWGFETLAGARFDLTGLTFGEAAVGWRQQNYQDLALSTVSGVTAKLALTSSITELTTLRLRVGRTIKETTLPGAAGAVATRGAVRADHELRRNLLLNARVGYETTRFAGIGRTDRTLDLRLGARYLMTPWLHWSLDLRHERRNSDRADAGYTVNAVALTARLQY